MARDLSTLGEIKYVAGATGRFIHLGHRQINFGEYPDSLDIELRSESEDEDPCIHAKIPFDAFFDALVELAQDYKVDA